MNRSSPRAPAPETPRALVLRTLQLIERQHRGSEDALTRTLDEASFPDRDRRLVRELVRGVLRMRGRLDHLISAASRRSLTRIDPLLLQILRMGSYQLVFLDRIPPHAAVNESVQLARRCRGKAASGFVNGVLRGLDVRYDFDELLESPHLEDRAAALSIPAWLLDRWESRLGMEQATSRCQAFLSRATLHLRLAPGIRPEEIMTPDHHSFSRGLFPDSLRITRGLPADISTSQKFYIQDEGSQMVSRLFAHEARGSILDACASPGGKILGLLWESNRRLLPVAVDRTPSRVSRLAANLQRLASGRCHVVRADWMNGASFPDQTFTRVLADAPCTGLGTLGRHPEIRWTRQKEDPARFASAQKALLKTLSTLVQSDGWLFYSVCSLEPEETDEVIAEFLSRHEDFSLQDPAPGHSLFENFRAADGVYRTSPERDGTHGFYAACLKRI